MGWYYFDFVWVGCVFLYPVVRQLALDAVVVVDLSELRSEALQPHELEEVVAGLEDPTDSLALLAAEYLV
ncbi:hypothetical protein N7486_004422 [Penicillium sp. IBT 16267x]|nr:hypothetical protein N7486_004422 [Penicillium sp. IBT 16267x]